MHLSNLVEETSLNSCDDFENESLDFIEQHMLESAENNSLTCKLCGKIFSRRFTLRRHLRCHTDQKPYSCSYCGKKFTRKDSCLYHTSVHCA